MSDPPPPPRLTMRSARRDSASCGWERRGDARWKGEGEDGRGLVIRDGEGRGRERVGDVL